MDAGVGVSPRLAIIGAGRAGRRFAQLCLSAGLDVLLEDVLPAKLRSAGEELRSEGLPQNAGQLRLVESVEDAVREADLAIDFVPDELESKLEIFSLIDRMAPPRTTILTPTECLSIADLASCTYRPERCFGLRGLTKALSAREAPHGVQELCVTLQYTARADKMATALVEQMLVRLGVPFRAALDEMPSMLTGRQ